jgi:ABC-2 type transport system permease protein
MSSRAEPAYGPSALGGSRRRFWELTLALARTEFKLRYFGSVLGYFWSLARPLLFFGVIYVFFTQILNVGKGIPHYGVYLLSGIVLWTFFGEATGTAVSSLVAREALLRKVRFPRLAVPLSVTLTSVFNLAMNLIAVFVFALINGVTPRLSWLWILPIVLGFMLMALGIGMLLSALYVRFRDIQPIWEVLVQALFYASPIMYVADNYAGYQHLAMLNPFALMLTQMGHAFIHPQAYHQLVLTAHGFTREFQHPMRSAAYYAGGLMHVLVSIAIIPATFALGFWFFAREAPRVAENL